MWHLLCAPLSAFDLLVHLWHFHQDGWSFCQTGEFLRGTWTKSQTNDTHKLLTCLELSEIFPTSGTYKNIHILNINECQPLNWISCIPVMLAHKLWVHVHVVYRNFKKYNWELDSDWVHQTMSIIGQRYHLAMELLGEGITGRRDTYIQYQSLYIKKHSFRHQPTTTILNGHFTFAFLYTSFNHQKRKPTVLLMVRNPNCIHAFIGLYHVFRSERNQLGQILWFLFNLKCGKFWCIQVIIVASGACNAML